MREASLCCQSSAITKEFADTFIDKIYVTPEKEDTLRLEIKILTGDTCEKYLEKLKRRADPGGLRDYTLIRYLHLTGG